MVKKKIRTPQKSKRKAVPDPAEPSWQEEDVAVNTGLPPQVEGQLRCFCRVSVTHITWIVPNTPNATYVQLKWWGEPGNGILFKPVDLKRSSSGHAKTTARFPVRSGPKQFAAYLADMNSLMLEVLSGPTDAPLGTVEVPNLGHLSSSKPINGKFPIISPTEDTIGELQVAMIIEPLMASYNSTGSIPTVDLSMETQASHVTTESTVPKKSRPPKPHSDQPRKPVDDPFISPASHQNVETRLVNGYTDDLRQHLHYEPDPDSRRYQEIQAGGTVAITTNGDVVRTSYGSDRSHADKENALSGPPVQRPADGDLLSVLLDRGNKLREQMIVSSLQSKNKAQAPASLPHTVTHDVPAGVPRRKPADHSMMSADGSFLQEILRAEKLYGGIDAADNIEENAVDLVFGGQLTDDIRMLKNLHGSPTHSISGDDDIISDYEDPIHNESILNELFYKNPASDDELSDLSDHELRAANHKNLDDNSNMRPPSRSSSVCSLNLAFPSDPKPLKSKTVKAKIGTPKRKTKTKLGRKGSKKRKRSLSRASRSGSECSDSDARSTASTRSECSRVSFDMVPSDIEEPPTREEIRTKVRTHRRSPSEDGMSVERLTLLGRVHVARVTIDNLQLAGQDLDTSRTKSKVKTKFWQKAAKPSPRPSPKTSKKTCTYFIEYQFPVVATSRDKASPNTMATEVMRVVSKDVKNGVVAFNHRSVFPVMFDGTAVESWWKSALVFKLYSRSAGQKVPSLLGSCGVPLKSILRSESLHIDKLMDVLQSQSSKPAANTSLNTSKQGHEGVLGALKVVVELASDNKDFATQLARTKLAEMTGKAKIVPIAQAPAAPKPPPAPSVPYQRHSAAEQSAPRGIESRGRSGSRSPIRQALREQALSIPAQVAVQHYDGDLNIVQYEPIQQLGEVMTLHALLMIPDGSNITVQGTAPIAGAQRQPVFHKPTALSAPGVRARDMYVRNTYLVCRMFWTDESVSSVVCWGSTEPQFKFQQIAPVLMSQSLLERLKNNFMIIEVWDKKTSADNDKLVGIVKISLHQFYMSFRDRRISSALLKSQYPVIAVENRLPVVDVFSGRQFGSLNVLLAMGSAEQVAHLVRMKTDGEASICSPERPHHFLERQDLMHQGETVAAQIGSEVVVEHIFEVVIEGVRGLSMDGMIWGEADCFVQYHFPTQQQTQPPGAPVIRHAVPVMKAFRTATTLCIADPTFHDVTRHRILLPQGTPVQRELLTACANAGNSSGGLAYELWCRYYHPNVRDQCMAKANLPLAKLCAMITMQKRGEPAVQTFSFPLNHVSTDGPEGERQKSLDAGMIDVTIHYKSQQLQSETGMAAANKNLSSAQVCLSVGIVRACGLKCAAESVAHHDQGMQYPAEVGVNAYVRVKLSFLGATGERITRTVARSFTPEFSHFMDFLCPLLWTEADSDALCLAEILESAEATFEVWHQVPGLSPELDQQLKSLSTENVTSRQLVEKTGDVLLGTTTLPLVALLSNRTGITGWFPVNIPVSAWNQERQGERETGQEEMLLGTSGLYRVGGGLELSVKFAHHEDRERVIHAARGVGWSPVDIDIEQDEWESEDEECKRYHHINIAIDHLSFPLQNALIAGQNTLDKTAQCYVRYKFYDKAAVMSNFCSVSVTSDGYITSKPKNKHDLQVPDSSMFKWYLREERLEVQVWVTYGTQSKNQQRPKCRDKLIGTAYVNMETLGDPRRKQHRVSGMYPLYKPGSCNLGGGYIRAYITTKPQLGSKRHVESQEGLITLDGEEIDVDYDPDDSFHQIRSHKAASSPPVKEVQQTPPVESIQDETTFPVVIQVERAFHLPSLHDKQKSVDYMPNAYVSYPTAEGTIQSYSSVFHNSDNPVWDHEHETKLSSELLYHDNKHLVFKVWHKPDGAPKSPDKLTDRVLGFVSVDLTPLANGMQQISGWYNIMDFNGQVKGQIKINLIPQASVSATGVSICSVAPAEPVNSSFLSFPNWTTPLSTLATPAPFTSLPSDTTAGLQHTEMLQQQLQDHIQQFIQRQEERQHQHSQESSQAYQPLSSEGTDRSQFSGSHFSAPHFSDATYPEPTSFVFGGAGTFGQGLGLMETSVHWRPNIPDMTNDAASSSRSYLFTSLRKQMQDLDEITHSLKSRLSCGPATSKPSEQNQNRSASNRVASTDLNRVSEFDFTNQSSRYPLTSTQTDLAFELPPSQQETPRDELTNTGSQRADSTRTVGDSGAYSVEQSNEKYDDSAPVSQRSASDRTDTLGRSGVTPRDFLDSGVPQTGNNSHTDDPEQNVWLTMSPRESNDRKDEYSESGGFSFRRSSPRDAFHNSRDTVHTPRDTPRTPRDATHTPRRDPYAQQQSQAHCDTNTERHAMSNEDLELMLNANINTNILQHIENAKRLLSEVKDSKGTDQKQMSIIQEYSENDRSDSEDESGNRYYHRYRDLLDTQDYVSDKEQVNDDNEEPDDEDQGEIIVPRRINDVSGKFSPTGEIIILSEDFSQSVPYGVNSLITKDRTDKNSVNGDSDRESSKQDSDRDSVRDIRPSSGESNRAGRSPSSNKDLVIRDIEDINSDGEECSGPASARGHTAGDRGDLVFDERDSWLSDSDKEAEENVVGYNRYLHNQAHLAMAKHKHQRQDSDTGYSSRDNVSESYVTPSAGGTNSEGDMSRLHSEQDHWSDQRESGEDQGFIDRAGKARLLSNVELESTGGSFGLRYDSGGPSRISSAGSRHTRKSSEQSVTESFDEREEQDYLKQELEPIHSARETNQTSQPTSARSARSEELNDFFTAESKQRQCEDIASKSVSEDEEFIEEHDNERIEYDPESGVDHEQVKAKSQVSSSKASRKSKGNKQPIPNFFMPVQHLEESLRSLQVVTNKQHDPQQEAEKAAATSEMAAKLTSKDKFAQRNTKSRLPTAEETKRIAKIFSSRFS